VVARNEIYWADLGPPAGRRPVCVLTRDAAASVLTAVTCVPITRTIRVIRSEVEIGAEEGLPEPCVINCDNILTVPLATSTRNPSAISARSSEPTWIEPCATPSTSPTDRSQPWGVSARSTGSLTVSETVELHRAGEIQAGADAGDLLGQPVHRGPDRCRVRTNRPTIAAIGSGLQGAHWARSQPRPVAPAHCLPDSSPGPLSGKACPTDRFDRLRSRSRICHGLTRFRGSRSRVSAN